MSDNDPITFRERFLRACRCRPVDRPPIWMMRQAGRSLPEYRALKRGRRFTELVRDPALAAEITLQPVRRFGYDAAVIFSDILVVAEALGQPYELVETGGVRMAFRMADRADVERLDPSATAEHTAYTPAAIRHVRKALGDERAIIGFAGSPWTLASYMIEGGSASDHARSLRMVQEDPHLIETLLEKITQATVVYLQAQIEAGADAIQLFDSQGGLLPPDLFRRFSGAWMKRIIDELHAAVPVIVFARNVQHDWNAVAATGADVLGIDYDLDLRTVCESIPGHTAVQGNLDPVLLTGAPEVAAAETRRILESMRGRDGFIFNLGHGVPPDARIETIQAVADTVQGWKNTDRA